MEDRVLHVPGEEGRKPPYVSSGTHSRIDPGPRWLPLRVLGQVHQPLADGVRRRLYAILQVQLLQDVVDVVLDCSLHDEQAGGDLRVAEAPCHQLKYLQLTRREVPGRVLARVMPGPLAELREQLARDRG